MIAPATTFALIAHFVIEPAACTECAGRSELRRGTVFPLVADFKTQKVYREIRSDYPPHYFLNIRFTA